jgi:hypothetical protein
MEKEEKQRLTAILYAILTTVLIGGSALFLLGLVTAWWTQVLTTAIVVAVSLGLLGLTRRGQLTLPRLGLPVLGVSIATYTAATANGLHDEGLFIPPQLLGPVCSWENAAL